MLAFCTVLAVLALAGAWLYRSDASALRKIKPYLALVGLLLAVVFGRPVAECLANLAFGAGDGASRVGSDVNASGAAIAADQAISGWVPSGTIFSKLFVAGIFFLFFVAVIWLTQRQTHPAPTKWAKNEYSRDFDARQPLAKFEIYQRIRLDYVILAAACIIGACLIQ